MPQIERYHIINFFEGRDDMTYNVKLKQKCSRINQTCDKAPFGAIFEHNYVCYTYVEEGYLKYHPRFVQIFSLGLLKIGSYKLCYE